MSDISTVRLLSGDPQQYASSTSIGDGSNANFQVPNAPIYPGTTTVYLDNALQTETTDYTIDESLGLITFTTAPSDGAIVLISGIFTLLSDDELQALIDLNSGSSDPIRLAAADAIDIIARTQALIQKKIKLLDLETDGPALAKELRASAKALRDLVLDPDTVETDWDIAEQVYDPPSYRERLRKERLRGGL